MGDNTLRIIIIGLNEASKIVRTFEKLSEFNLLDKTIFIDSESSDNSIEICKRHSVTHFVYRGIKSAARLRSYGAANYRLNAVWTVFLDGDVIPSAEFLDSIKNMDRKASDVWFGWKRDISPAGKVSYHTKRMLIRSPDFLGGNFVMRTELYNEIGGWNSNLIADEERDLLARVYSVGSSVKQVNLWMGDHLNDNKAERSIRERYFGLRAKSEVETLMVILRKSFLGGFKVYKFSFIILLGLAFIPFSPLFSLVVLIANHLFFCYGQPGKYLLLLKLAVYWPYLRWLR